MAEYSIPYGKSKQIFHLPEGWPVSILKPELRDGLNNPVEEITAALNKLGKELSARNETSTAVIAVNDKTRPVPHNLLLPPLLNWLEELGYKRENISLIIATGTHAPMPPEEHHLIVPEEISRKYTIISHDAEDKKNLIELGETTAGTPCTINRIYAEADLRVVVGNIEPHQYMGWSGGVKSAVIGLGGAESIRTNHSMLTMNGAGPCRYKDNPVRQDVEESGRIIDVQLALNVVMNDSKEIVAVFAGDPLTVMKKGIKEAQSLFSVPIDSEYDLVITSPGGHPKDINLYQAQKALRHAAPAAKPDAPMILTGACGEGIGSPPYERWMKDKTSHQQVQEAFENEEFKLGPHKAMLFATDAMNRDVYLVSELPDETVRKMLLIPASSVQEAIGMIQKTGDSSIPLKTAILPYGNATVPYPED